MRILGYVHCSAFVTKKDFVRMKGLSARFEIVIAGQLEDDIEVLGVYHK